MKMISTTEAANKHGVSVRRIQKLIRDGRIPAAQRISKIWLLPEKFDILPPPKRRHAPLKIKTTAS